MLSSSNFQLSLFLMSTKLYLKFRTIRGTPPKWVGFGKPLLGSYVFVISMHGDTNVQFQASLSSHEYIYIVHSNR